VRPNSDGFARVAGRGVCGWRRHRGDARAGKVVPGPPGRGVQLSQHHARAGGDGGVLDAPGDGQGPPVDGQRRRLPGRRRERPVPLRGATPAGRPQKSREMISSTENSTQAILKWISDGIHVIWTYFHQQSRGSNWRVLLIF